MQSSISAVGQHLVKELLEFWEIFGQFLTVLAGSVLLLSLGLGGRFCFLGSGLINCIVKLVN